MERFRAFRRSLLLLLLEESSGIVSGWGASSEAVLFGSDWKSPGARSKSPAALLKNSISSVKATAAALFPSAVFGGRYRETWSTRIVRLRIYIGDEH